MSTKTKSRTRSKQPVEKCKHCTIHDGIKARGLCIKCYREPAIRELYPRKPNGMTREPTWEEVEQMCRENWATMPRRREGEE